MKGSPFFRGRRPHVLTKALAVTLCMALALPLFAVTPAMAQQNIITTPTVPPELPIEIETDLAPGSLKQAPLWHEIAQLLDDPTAITCTDPADPGSCTANIVRRQSFGVTMPPLNVWNPCFNVLTGQPMRLRTSDGEISWDQPGFLFAPQDTDPLTNDAVIIGNLVVDTANNLVVSNPDDNVLLPPDGEIVAVPACNAAGQIVDIDGNVITEFEKPISELDFFRPATDIGGVPAPLQPFIGRPGAQALGKALFWDMQVGSDGVQACASCHFHAGVDNRTRNQLNPNHLGGDLTFQVKQPNQELVASDFPFHKLIDIDGPGDPLILPSNVASDANDIASSMGVRFRKFGDIPTPGPTAFGLPSPIGGVRPLLPDCPVPDGVTPQPAHCVGQPLPPVDPTAEVDPIPGFQGLRRVEPRNTPTIFGAAFNFDNFWDGRARHDSNGGSVFGPTDPQFHVFIDPGPPNGAAAVNLQGASNGHFRPDLIIEDPEVAAQPVRIRFSSLASLATGPALSEFEMSFAGRNWAKIGKKLLQGDVPNVASQSSLATANSVVPLANQLVATTDSVLGPFSNQGGSVCSTLGRATAAGKPGLCISYGDLIRLSYIRELWHNTNRHLNGAPAVCTSALNGVLTPAGCDPFDGYVLTNVPGAAITANTNQFRQIEANFSLFFGQSLQSWQQLLIPDDTAFDRFMDANPRAQFAVAQPGEQGTLPPSTVAGIVGPVTLVPGFGPDEVFGFDIFAGANLTAALPVGNPRNPTGVGSNPFLRTARCMLCHFGPEGTDHTNNVNAGLLLSDTEFEFPTVVFTPQNSTTNRGPEDSTPEPTGPFRLVTGIALAEEVEENAQDGVEMELRNFATVDDPNTPWDDRVIAAPNAFSFQDNGVYNIGVRPTNEDIMRGGTDAFGWPLSIAALSLKNLAGPDFEPCDTPDDVCTGAMANFDPDLGPGGGLFGPTGADQRVNPGLAMDPLEPLLPPYLAPWVNHLPAGELHPQIDELAVAPNTLTAPVGGPLVEYGEILFGADFNCGTYDPVAFGAGPPNFGWGPQCPNAQSAVPNNFDQPLNGTWPFVNRVARNGAVKAPQLRNVELTGPYFHTGSYLTLRQVVDFYSRGGDFPVTNGEDRDPNLTNLMLQAFSFGATNASVTANLPPELADGFPDALSAYGPMPDTNPTNADTFTNQPTPEYATPEDAKVALVKFLLSLTDNRVKFERAPFDHPEIIVPLDGTAPDNAPVVDPVTGIVFAGGREALVADSTANPLNLAPRFRLVPAVGAAGNATPLPGFLGVTTNPNADCVTEISHFCR